MRCDHGEIISSVDFTNISTGATSEEEQIHSEVIATQKKHLALMLFTADCLPVSFYDPVTHTIALAHISRKTLVNKLPQKTVVFLRHTFSAMPKNLLVQVGPHIQKESYAFPLPLQEIPQELNGYIEERNEQAYINLSGALVRQLTTAGIIKGNIMLSTENTTNTQKYFSYYLMKKQGKQKEARMATILMMR